MESKSFPSNFDIAGRYAKHREQYDLRYGERGEKIDKATLLAKVGNSIRQDRNTSLKFYVYDQDVDNGLDSFPDLGIHYGVFGTSSEPDKKNGWILTDDEDSNNQNLSWYNGLLLEHPGNSELRNSVRGIVEPSANTIIHMYKVR